MSKAKIGIVTVSDRASAGIYEDISGKAIIDTLNDYLTSEWEPIYQVIPDEQDVIEATLIKMADELDCCLIVTTGGTGPAKRDVTPEATRAVCDRDVPGIAEAIRAYSMTKTRRAMLSRAVCMQRGYTLVVNFPGSTKAARESWEAIADQLEHAAQMTAGGGHTN